MGSEVNISTNWKLSHGQLSVRTVTNIDDVNFDEMTPESCVLLSHLGDDDRCEIQISGPTASIAIVTDCQR